MKYYTVGKKLYYQFMNKHKFVIEVDTEDEAKELCDRKNAEVERQKEIVRNQSKKKINKWKTTVIYNHD